MVSMVTPTFKYFNNPVRPQTTAKQTDQDINSLIFNFFSLLEESFAWGRPELNRMGDLSTSFL
jgi:hypothetical protein